MRKYLIVILVGLLVLSTFMSLNAYHNYNLDRIPDLQVSNDPEGILAMDKSNTIRAGFSGETLMIMENQAGAGQSVTITLDGSPWWFSDGSKTRTINLGPNSIDTVNVYVSPRAGQGATLSYDIRSVGNNESFVFEQSDNVFVDNRWDWVVNPDKGVGDFNTIQAAVDNSTTGDNVFIEGGTYPESVNVPLDIELYASPHNRVLVETVDTYGFLLESQSTLVGFEIDASQSTNGIEVDASKNQLVDIRNNEVYNAESCIISTRNEDLTIYNNEVYGCTNGVYLNSKGDIIDMSQNLITENTNGIHADSRKGNIHSSNNNEIIYNDYGILIVDYDTNFTVVENNIYGNVEAGVQLDGRIRENIDIRNNWWGHDTGPSGGAEDVNTGVIADGQGDAIINNGRGSGGPGTPVFMFDPWSNESQ